VQPGPDVFDPDLDPPPRRTASPDRESIVEFQRLVVNPFLAVLVFIVIVALFRTALVKRSWSLFDIGVVLFGIDVFLIQYHCLDCGATGWLLGVRRHVCGAVQARWQRGERRRFRGPGVRIQLVVWLVFLLAVTMLGLIIWIAD
jgi:hypothetical protein